MSYDTPIESQDRYFAGLKCTCAPVIPSGCVAHSYPGIGKDAGWQPYTCSTPKDFPTRNGYSEGSLWTVVYPNGDTHTFVFTGMQWSADVILVKESPLMHRSEFGNTNSPSDQWSAWVYLISDYTGGPGV